MPGLVAEGLAIQRLRFVVGAAAAVRSAEFVFLCVGTPQGDDGSADLSAIEAVAREIAPLLATGSRRRQQVARCRWAPPASWPAGSPSPGVGARRPRRVQPRVPARGHRGTRLPPAAAHRDRVRRPDRRGARLRAVPRRPGADRRHRRRVGRDDQAGVERVPRHEDLVHQRDRQRVRGGERRRARRRARHGLRPADRLRLPAPRSGLRRRVPPEGHRRRCCAPPSSSATTSACCAACST